MTETENSLKTFLDFDAYVRRYTNYERAGVFPYDSSRFNLDVVRHLCARLGDPQDRYASLHIAGTNGKGSTSWMAAAMLGAHGLRTGLYSSPHLLHMSERVSIDGQPIDEITFVAHANRLLPLLEEIRPPVWARRPTFFEILTTIAFLAFADGGIDVAVVETGMGGRLDTTNLLSPRATAITSIGLDHTAQLGDTLEKIAGEKAGIVKRGIPLVLGDLPPPAFEVVSTRASALGAPVVRFGSQIVAGPAVPRPGGATGFAVRTPRRVYEDLTVPLVGVWLPHNAALAIGLCEALEEQGAVGLDPGTCRQALASTSLQGRGQTFRLVSGALALIDGAHNPEGADRLGRTLDAYFPDLRRTLLFGVCADRDFVSMLRSLGPTGALHACPVDSPRSAAPAAIAAQAAGVLGIECVCWESGGEAFRRLIECSRPGELVVVTGSLYLVGEVLRMRNAVERVAPQEVHGNSRCDWKRSML